MHAPALVLVLVLGALFARAEPAPEPAPAPEPDATVTLGAPPPATPSPPAPAPAPDPEPSSDVAPPPEPDPSTPAEPVSSILTQEEIEAEDDLFAEDEPEPEVATDTTTPAQADPSAADPPATAESFQLQPPAPAESRPPSVFGRTWITFGIGASASGISLGLGAVRFVIPHVGVGGDIEDTVLFGPPSTNIFQVTPKVVLLALPYRRFTPLLQTGLGLAVISRVGVFARWLVGAGVAFVAGRRFTVRLGLDLEGLVPDERFAQSFRCPITSSPCSLLVSPWIGFGLRF